MLRYTLLVLLYITTCSIALESSIANGTAVDALSDTFTANSSELLSGMNESLTPAHQIISSSGPNQRKMQTGVNLVQNAGNDYLNTSGMGAHKLHTRKVSWNKARKICIQEGAHLAVINSNSEEKILLRILDENNLNAAWLGIHDLYEEGDWNTIMDQALEATGYSKWSSKYPNLPDNDKGNQHCGQLLKEGGLDDYQCFETNAFFCKITV